MAASSSPCVRRIEVERTMKSGSAFNFFSMTAAALVSICAALTGSQIAYANPEGGTVAAGDATISSPNASTTIVNQKSNTLILNWDSFNIDAGEVTQFLQPNSSSLAVNRIGGNDPTSIYGSLLANGRIILINPNGHLFGDTAQVNVGSLIATTHDAADADIFAGRYSFDISGNPTASITNQGTISTQVGGSVAFVAPGVSNTGTITATLGSITLGAASKFTLDFTGDSLITFPVDAGVVQRAVGADGQPVEALVSNSGSLTGSKVVLSARTAGDIVANAINMAGSVIATSASIDGDDIVLLGGEDSEFAAITDLREPTRLFREKRRQLRDPIPGQIVIDGGESGIVNVTGIVDASGVKGGDIRVSGQTVYADGDIRAMGTNSTGGHITVNGNWVSIGGLISADGNTDGGLIEVGAGGFSFAGLLSATAQTGQGGTVAIDVARKSLEFKGALIDVSGAAGGAIRNVAGQQITSSATYLAIGRSGSGGTIDVSASATKLLSPTLNASGYTAGGRIRIGGEYQGGKSLTTDELPNARTTVASDGTKLFVDVLGPNGAGGTAIVWSDAETVFLGSIFARPGTQAGAGGFVEISSAELLQYAGHIETGVGNRQGTILFDPKDINIVDVAVSGIQLQLVLGYNFVGLGGGNPLAANDRFGHSVALDGNLLAVGAYGDDGFESSSDQSGAVYLFTFDADTDFLNLAIVGIIGSGFTGGRNINLVSELDAGDWFGYSISLDGNRLAVGAVGDDGSDENCPSCGAIHLFNFTDPSFVGGNLIGTIGFGYDGLHDTDTSGLGITSLGASVSLDGLGLAAGNPGDVGIMPGCQGGCGAVYLFSFANEAFEQGQLRSRIGRGYANPNDMDLSSVISDDEWFGSSVSLDQGRLAVGMPFDHGGGAFCSNCGSVFLFTFADSAFSGGQLQSTIGSGYLGPKDFNISLQTQNLFGRGVALDGNWLMVGVPGDDGQGNLCGSAFNSCGAVYGFHFGDTSFSAANLMLKVGSGYNGALDIDIGSSLQQRNEFVESFGQSVAFDGTRLVVGIPGDAGSDGSCTSCGSIKLFLFNDTELTGGILAGTVGAGYIAPGDFDTNSIGISLNDAFGQSVSLDGLRLAVGAPGDDGFGAGPTATQTEYGAVYLFSFSNESFAGATLEAIIGKGYTGGRNIDLGSRLDIGDLFGYSVSLDANRLAVGALLDDGAGLDNNTSSVPFGAVYLFTFGGDTFSSSALAGVIGSGYTEANDVPLTLADMGSDFAFLNGSMGASVSLDGNQLAVGGANAAYLFTFADSAFANGQLVSRLGRGFSGANDRNMSAELGTFDRFGFSVALDAGRLAIGAPLHENTSHVDAGTVYLFTFDGLSFANLDLVGYLGAGYSGVNDIDIEPQSGGVGFGNSLSLDGNLLAVGVETEFGVVGTGTVHLFTFSGSDFTGGSKISSIGRGYAGDNDYDTNNTAAGVLQFGRGVSIDGERLAVGSPLGGSANTGSVYLFTTGSAITPMSATFGASVGSDATISKNSILQLLSSGQNVILQANNDILLSTDLEVVPGCLCAPGALILQAGRGIYLDGSIKTNNGSLYLFANTPTSEGAQSAYRESGPAEIYQASNKFINVGTGEFIAQIMDGAGLTFNAGGDITLRQITAGHVSILTMGGTGGAVNVDGPISLSSGQFTSFIEANSDVHVNGDITAAASLIVEAGRSILLLGSITTDDADVTLIANSANAVVGQRGIGPAILGMSNPLGIDAGTGDVFIQISLGGEASNITLTDIVGGSVFIDNLTGTGRDIRLFGDIRITDDRILSLIRTNNDLFVFGDILVSHALPNGTDLLLEAGRSIELHGEINSDGGDVTIIANSGSAHFNHRLPGLADITMFPAIPNTAPAASIVANENNTVSGRVQIRMDNFGDNLLAEGGNIILRSVTARRDILVENLSRHGGDVFVNDVLGLSDVIQDPTRSIIVAATSGIFVNAYGPDVLDPADGRFLVYQAGLGGRQENSLAAYLQFGVTYNPANPSGTLQLVSQTGNIFLFSALPPAGSELNYWPNALGVLPSAWTLTNDQMRRTNVWINAARNFDRVNIRALIADVRLAGDDPWPLLGRVARDVGLYAALSDAAYYEANKTLYGVTRISRGAVGIFNYSVYEIDGKIVVSFEGTDDPADAVADIAALFYAVDPFYRDQALQVVEDLIKRYGRDNVSCTGHSFGGTLCAYTSAKVKVPGVVFDQMPVDYDGALSDSGGLLTSEERAALKDSLLAVNSLYDIASQSVTDTSLTQTAGTEYIVPLPADERPPEFYEFWKWYHSMTYLNNVLADFATPG